MERNPLPFFPLLPVAYCLLPFFPLLPVAYCLLPFFPLLPFLCKVLLKWLRGQTPHRYSVFSRCTLMATPRFRSWAFFFLAILRLMAVGWLVGGGFGTFIKQEIGGGFAFAFNLNFTAIL